MYISLTEPYISSKPGSFLRLGASRRLRPSPISCPTSVRWISTTNTTSPWPNISLGPKKPVIERIVFLVDNPFGRRNYERFGIELLTRNGFRVEVWDATG